MSREQVRSFKWEDYNEDELNELKRKLADWKKEKARTKSKTINKTMR
jgi:hypothetical protein